MIETVRASNGRVLGEIIERTYLTPRSPAHFFVKFNGFGISTDTLNLLYERGVKFLVFDYNGAQQKYYRITLLNFLRHGEEWTDNSWGKPDKQLICSIERMNSYQISTPEELIRA